MTAPADETKDISEFGRGRLPDHTDAEEWPGIPVGQWELVSCEDYQQAIGDRSLRVWSSLTDPSGDYGRPEVYTLWGNDGDLPVAASLALYDRRDRTKVVRCLHARYVVGGAAVMTARYRETSACPPGTCFEAEAVGATGYGCAGECLVALSMAGRFVEDVPAPELFGEGAITAPATVEPDDGSDIEPALGERFFCGGCGAELWEHADDDEPCCDWRPWED